MSPPDRHRPEADGLRQATASAQGLAMPGLSAKGEFSLGGTARSAKGAPESVEHEALDEVLTHHGRDPHTLVQILRGTQQQLCPRTAKTCTNILKLWSALWTFTTNTALSPTNNAAEQALRSIVLKRKISGSTRSLRGDHFVASGFSVHETCLRQGVDLWKFMHEAVLASIANTMPPSLIPRPLAAVPTG